VIDEDGRVIHEVRFAHSVERVWAAIANQASLAQWLMGNDFEPRVGHSFHFDARPSRGWIDAEVLALEPPTRMQLQWMLDGVATTVTFTLRADGDGTLLRLEHAGIADQSRSSFDGGWVEKFDALTELLEGAP